MDVLDVWLYDRCAGRLERRGGQLSFAYAPDYVSDPGPPLSTAMSVRGEPYGHAAAESFFANLLPEGKARRALAKLAHITDTNDYGLLAAFGGDCAGAVSLHPPGTEPSPGGKPRGSGTESSGSGPGQAGSVDWLDERRLAAAIDDLPRRPLMADPDGDIRISLPGAQDKLVVVVDGDRIGLPAGSTPSSHIIKTPIDAYDDTVANEAFCLRLARELGLDAAHATAERLAGRELLLIERYDRRPTAAGTARIHQEDFCQALGLPPESKYENEGGPGLAACFWLVGEAAVVPAPDTLRLVDAATFNFLIGNHDAHAKNFSLLHAPSGTRLAPFYDLLSTTVYELGDKMAMKLGGEYRAGYVRRRHVERFARDAGLGVAPTLRRVRAFAARTVGAAESLAGELRADGAHRPVIDRIVETVSARAEQLDSELGPRAH
jgi:serine/threonine-protein kinase HipA